MTPGSLTRLLGLSGAIKLAKIGIRYADQSGSLTTAERPKRLLSGWGIKAMSQRRQVGAQRFSVLGNHVAEI